MEEELFIWRLQTGQRQIKQTTISLAHLKRPPKSKESQIFLRAPLRVIYFAAAELLPEGSSFTCLSDSRSQTHARERDRVRCFYRQTLSSSLAKQE